MNGKTRSGLLGAAAIYLLYLSWQLFQGRNDPDTSMTAVPRILFIALFVLAAAAILVYALRLWLQSSRDEKHPPEDPGSLK